MDDDKTPPYGTPILGEWFTPQAEDPTAGTEVKVAEPAPKHELKVQIYEDVGRLTKKVRRRIEVSQDDFLTSSSEAILTMERVLEFMRKTGVITETAELVLKERAQRLQDDGYLAP